MITDECVGLSFTYIFISKLVLNWVEGSAIMKL
jgi:hypothetical protein